MTIYALSTAPLKSGIAIIRISGLETKKILEKLTLNVLPNPEQQN